MFIHGIAISLPTWEGPVGEGKKLISLPQDPTAWAKRIMEQSAQGLPVTCYVQSTAELDDVQLVFMALEEAHFKACQDEINTGQAFSLCLNRKVLVELRSAIDVALASIE